MPSETQVFELVSALVLTLIGAWIANKTGLDGSSVPTLDAKIVAMTAELQSIAAGLPDLVIGKLADKVRADTNTLIATKAATDAQKIAAMEVAEAVISAAQGLIDRGVKDATAELADPFNFITGTPSKGVSPTVDTAMANIRIELDSKVPITVVPIRSWHKNPNTQAVASYAALVNRKKSLAYDYGSLVVLFRDWPTTVIPLYATFLSINNEIVSLLGQVDVDLSKLIGLKTTAWELWGTTPPYKYYSETVIDPKLAGTIATSGTQRCIILTTMKADVTTQEALFELGREISSYGDFRIVLPATMKKGAGIPSTSFVPLVYVQPGGFGDHKSTDVPGETDVAYYTVQIDP